MSLPASTIEQLRDLDVGVNKDALIEFLRTRVDILGAQLLAVQNENKVLMRRVISLEAEREEK